MKILKCRFQGMDLDPKAEVELRGNPIMVYDHRGGPAIFGHVGQIPKSSLSEGPGTHILTGEVHWLGEQPKEPFGRAEPVGHILKSHMQSMKVWYNPWTWGNRPVRVIDLLDLKAVSIVG